MQQMHVAIDSLKTSLLVLSKKKQDTTQKWDVINKQGKKELKTPSPSSALQTQSLNKFVNELPSYIDKYQLYKS
jgi:hypothetical protein